MTDSGASPTGGAAQVNGFDVVRQPMQVRRTIGVLTETPGMYDRLSAAYNLTVYARLYEVDDPARQVQKYLSMLGLWDRRKEPVGSFSKGMKQKLAIARALLHEPQTLFLDEPTAGLDPAAARTVREFIEELRTEGRTIFLTTHNLDEAQRLCDRIGVMQLNEPFTWTTGVGPAGLNPRLQAIVAAARRGTEVRVLLDDTYDSKNTETCLTLKGIAAQEGLDLTCRLENVTGLGVHAKTFLVSVGDERWVHLGSINGTENANKSNREVALQFRSAAAYDWTLAVFDHDWGLSHAPMIHRTILPLVTHDHVPPADYPLVSEVLINPEGDDAGKEWIELYNPGPEADISGWMVGDAVNAGDYGDGRHAFPAGAALFHGQVMALAACATDFSTAYGFNPAYEWTDCDPTVPDLVAAGSWEGFGMALGNKGDEVVLLDAGGGLVDSAAWGGESRAGVVPYPLAAGEDFPWGASLKRYPPGSDRDDCSRDFYTSYSPSPGMVAGD